MQRVHNFSAGPATLPLEVLQQARDELTDWNGSGMSVMEMSHRGRHFMAIAARAEQDLRDLLAIPPNYKVLFLQGGAHTQFAMIPLNLLRGRASADYLDTGDWSLKAIGEARRLGGVRVVASSAANRYTTIPPQAGWETDAQAAYFHYTPNETIRGVEFHQVPVLANAGIPLVADMSSNILSRPVDVSRFGLIYAGAQKNIGPAGLTLVIVREDLIGQARAGTPTMLDYATFANSDSMYNTPPTYTWYMAGLVFQWLKQQGGLAVMAGRNQRKSARLYAAIDDSDGFYRCPVAAACRSWMNVTFTLADAGLEPVFLQQAEAAGLSGLKGHRLVGGMRASLYNAMPEAGVDALIDFMADFRHRHG